MPQYKILESLHKKKFKIKKSRLSQIVKWFVENQYIKCTIKSVYKTYTILPKVYRREKPISRWGRKTLRVHNHRFYLKVNASHIDDDSMWDTVKLMKNGTKQYIYHGHNDDGPVTIQRMKGTNKDTILLILPDVDWSYITLEEHDQYVWRSAYTALRMVEKHFKVEADIERKMKWSYAIQNPPEAFVQRALQSDNYHIGDWEGDASKGVPELETDDRNKMIAYMELINRAPELLKELLEREKKQQDYIQ